MDNQFQKWVNESNVYKEELPEVRSDAAGFYLHYTSDPFNFRLRRQTGDKPDEEYSKLEWKPMANPKAHTEEFCQERIQPSKVRWNSETHKCESFRRRHPIGDLIHKYGSLNHLIQALAAAILNAPPLPISIDVWRGVTKDVAPLLRDLVPKALFIDKAFVSTTRDKERAVSYVMEEPEDKKESTRCCLMKIRIPKGSRVLWDRMEEQILLPPNVKLQFIGKGLEERHFFKDLATGHLVQLKYPVSILVYEFNYIDDQ